MGQLQAEFTFIAAPLGDKAGAITAIISQGAVKQEGL
jgi:hypothetical protein